MNINHRNLELEFAITQLLTDNQQQTLNSIKKTKLKDIFIVKLLPMRFRSSYAMPVAQLTLDILGHPHYAENQALEKYLINELKKVDYKTQERLKKILHILNMNVFNVLIRTINHDEGLTCGSIKIENKILQVHTQLNKMQRLRFVLKQLLTDNQQYAFRSIENQKIMGILGDRLLLLSNCIEFTVAQLTLDIYYLLTINILYLPKDKKKNIENLLIILIENIDPKTKQALERLEKIIKNCCFDQLIQMILNENNLENRPQVLISIEQIYSRIVINQNMHAIFQHVQNRPWESLHLLSQNYNSICTEVLNPIKFLKCDGFKHYAKTVGIPVASIYFAPMVASAIGPVLGNITLLNQAGHSIQLLWNRMTDPTEYYYSFYDEDGDFYEGWTSNLEQTKVFGTILFIFVVVPTTTITIAKTIDKIEEKGSVAKLVFSRYFEWQATQLKKIKLRYEIPAGYKNHPQLKIEGNICEKTGEVLCFPVITPQGHRFEHYVIFEWLKDNPNCPVTHAPLSLSEIQFDEITYQRIRQFIFKDSQNTPISPPNFK